MNTKLILRLGAVATALAAIGGVTYASIPTARGLLESGPLPLAGKEYIDTQVAALSTQLQQIQRQNMVQSTTDANNLKLTALTRQQFLEGELMSAELDARKSPSHAANQYICTLIQQINSLRPINNLPQIPVPPICYP